MHLVFICCSLLLDFHILITLLGLLLLSDKIFGWVIFIRKLYSFLCPYQICFFLFFFHLFCNYYSCTFYFFIKVFITLCTACDFLMDAFFETKLGLFFYVIYIYIYIYKGYNSLARAFEIVFFRYYLSFSLFSLR